MCLNRFHLSYNVCNLIYFLFFFFIVFRPFLFFSFFSFFLFFLLIYLYNRCTPLHYAASGGHASLVALLLMYGAAAACQDAMGYTAQDYAVQSNHMEVVQLLFHTGGGEETSSSTAAETTVEEDPTQEEEDLAKASEDLWQEYIDPSSGCPYYYNLLIGETTWERPIAFKPAIAAAAAQEKAKKTDERLADAAEGGEVGAAFLLERWRRVAWREGMRRVVINQKKKARKFALAQAKARAHLLKQGGEGAKSAAKQMGLSKEEADAMSAKLNEAAAMSSKEMDSLKAALAAKDKQLGGMAKQMELMGTSQLQEARDEFER